MLIFFCHYERKNLAFHYFLANTFKTKTSNGCFPFFGTKLIELMRIFKDVLLFWSFKYFQAHFSSHFKHIPALLAFLSMSRIVKNFLACSIICLQFFALSIIFKHFWHFLHVWHFLIFLARLSFWVLLRLARTNNHSFQHFLKHSNLNVVGWMGLVSLTTLTIGSPSYCSLVVFISKVVIIM